jgi:hypothetical protein
VQEVGFNLADRYIIIFPVWFLHLFHNGICFSRFKNFGLTIARDISGKASGDLFWDDGESTGTVGQGLYHYGVFNFDNVG